MPSLRFFFPLFVLSLSIFFPSIHSKCSAKARYKITFSYDWSKSTDPNFPDNQAQIGFTRLMCMSHNSNFSLWTPGQVLPLAMQHYLRREDLNVALQELFVYVRVEADQKTVLSYVRALPTFVKPKGSTTVFLPTRTEGNLTLLSCIARVWPSKDWIIGLSNLNVCENGEWKRSVLQNLDGFDGGMFDSQNYGFKSEKEPAIKPVRKCLGIAARVYGIAMITKQDSDIPPASQRPVANMDKCVAVHHLVALPAEHLVFAHNVRAWVLCDMQGSCATPAHIVRWEGRTVTMRGYCHEVACTWGRTLVNSPRWRPGLRVGSHTNGLTFTALAARFETRMEEAALRFVVMLGG